MRTADVDILIVPDWAGAGPDHWQSRWARSLRTARSVVPAAGSKTGREDWVEAIIKAVADAARPAVLVAHGSGVAAVAHAAPELEGRGVAAAYLVAPTDLEAAESWLSIRGRFTPLPLAPLLFPSLLVASANDPHCTIDRARQFAAAWGATFVPAGEAGHIDDASGHGPWPEGLMRFGLLLSRIGSAPPRR